MQNSGTQGWDEARYLELNAFFRVRIRTILESDPYLKQVLTQGNGLDLDQLTGRMSLRDQELWAEFMLLDLQKFHHDLQNHLEGRGQPLNAKNGFGKPISGDPDEPPTW